MNIPSLCQPAFSLRADIEGLEFEGRRQTFCEIESEANRLAARLRADGLVTGDRVAVYMKNSPELIVAYLAAVGSGFIFTPINILYRGAEIEHILGDAEPAALFADRQAEDVLAPLLERLPSLRLYWTGDLAEFAATQIPADAAGEQSQNELSDDAVAALVYTSGTTGKPKGAMLTHGNFTANALNLVNAWQMTAEDRLLLSLPLFHVHGLGNGLHTWLALGYRTRLLERFLKETIVDEFLEFRPTVFFGVPTMYERLLDTPREKAHAIGGFMRLFVSGSAPLPVRTLEKFRELFGHTILERYGMSETLMNTSNPYDGERRPGSVGLPMPNVSIRLCDAETGAELGEGETGEVQISGSNVFAGYWRRPEATAEAFTEDGFFRSGDLGVRSGDGYITLQGRGKELIICGGFNVYPREVEEFLTKLPGVGEAAVVGVGDQLKGEVPMAFIVAAEGEEPDAAALQQACRDGLASFKVPRRFVVTGALPRNALGKVQKHLLMTEMRP